MKKILLMVITLIAMAGFSYSGTCPIPEPIGCPGSTVNMDGGTFEGDVTFTGDMDVTGDVTIGGDIACTDISCSGKIFGNDYGAYSIATPDCTSSCATDDKVTVDNEFKNGDIVTVTVTAYTNLLVGVNYYICERTANGLVFSFSDHVDGGGTDCDAGDGDQIDLVADTPTGNLVRNEDGNFGWDDDNGNPAFRIETNTGNVEIEAGDLIVGPDLTGGNAGERSQITGFPKIKLVPLGALTDGTAETLALMDDSPSGECAPTGVNVTENTDSTTIYRLGSVSYHTTFSSAAVANDGFTCSITTAPDDWEANENVGAWIRLDADIASNYFRFVFTDDGGDRKYPITVDGTLPANKWLWVEVDISDLAAGTGDAISTWGMTIMSDGADELGEVNLYVDGPYKWDNADEFALGEELVQDGVMSVVGVATAAGSANTSLVLTENTDYFIADDRASTDSIVIMTDRSLNSGMGLIAYE